MNSLRASVTHPLDFAIPAIFASALALGGLSSAKATAADQIETTADTAPIEEVLVVGRRPGPPLWRAVSGDNTLWIFATLSPLPKHLNWDNSSVKHLLSEATAFIEPPDVSATTSNPFKAISTLRKLTKLEKLPDGTRLKDVVPTDLYSEFREFKSIYAPRARGIERLRPMPAAEKLIESVYKRAGLTNEDRVYPKLLKLAKRQKLEIYSSTSNVALDEVIEIFNSISMDAEVSCLRTTLRSIAIDLHASMERANAWADGDAQQLLRLDYPDARKVCSLAISDMAIAQQAMQHSNALWLQHAKTALAYNRVTVTSLPISQIARSDGLLSKLREAGYEIKGQ